MEPYYQQCIPCPQFECHELTTGTGGETLKFFEDINMTWLLPQSATNLTTSRQTVFTVRCTLEIGGGSTGVLYGPRELATLGVLPMSLWVHTAI